MSKASSKTKTDHKSDKNPFYCFFIKDLNSTALLNIHKDIENELKKRGVID
ncbi:MAG: hypothetical protein ACTSPO_16030 [Candidatus Heimdallarchaeaceae archaeon]